MPSFVVTRDGNRIQVFPLQTSKTTIGRKGTPGADRLLLDDSTVSTDHAVVERHGNRFMVQDLHSRNGILLNGEILPPGRLYPLQVGDKVQVCDYVLVLEADASSPAPAPVPAAAPPPAPAPAPVPAAAPPPAPAPAPVPPEAAPPAPAMPPPPKPVVEPSEAGVLPTEFGGFAFQRVYTPRDVVGGDFFLSHRLPDGRLAVGIGDATGGAEPVIELTVRCMEKARLVGTQNLEPSGALAWFQKAVGPPHGARTVSFLYGILDTQAGTFRFANAGHVPPLVFNRGRPDQVRKLVLHGDPLLPGAEVSPDAHWNERNLAVGPGDVIVLCTDGVIQAAPGHSHEHELDLKNRIREGLTQSWGENLSTFLKAMKARIEEVERSVTPFGFEGVARIVASHGGEGVRKLLPAVEAALREYIQGEDPDDDLTLIAFERTR
jgi:serine phosphatase RsbU (regulator of sigma subunit)